MVRIAKVKFNSNGKLYDYFCSDISINEGDVVFVEGKEEPVFVYEIEEKNMDATCKATKNVIKKAKVNSNVILESKYMNITKCSCECIVNSLGPGTNVFGAICKSIVQSAKSEDINSMLKNHPTANIFDIFVTDSGALPSKHVIHIVMPFKNNDKCNENLKKAFSMVIDKAIALGYESIGIPYIGTGANGYEKEDIAQALNSILFEYQYKDNIKIKIVSIVYNTVGDSARLQGNELKHYNEDRIYESIQRMHRNQNPYQDGRMYPNVPLRDREKSRSKSYYYSDLKTHFILEAIENYYNGEDEYELTKKVDNPVDYIRDFKKKKKLYDVSADYVAALSYSNQTKVSSGERQIRRNEVINLAIACKMNFTEFIQFMFFSGFAISTNSKDDIEIALLQYLIDNKQFKGLALTYNELANNTNNGAINTLFPHEINEDHN